MRIIDHPSPRVARRCIRGLASALLLFVPPALACSVSVPPLAFGSINPLHGADSDSATTITIDCKTSTSYSVALSAGNSMQLERVMHAGAATLVYNLYTDASHNLIWGDGSAGTVLVSGSDPGTGSTHTVYARIPAQPQAVPGSYGDNIVVTVSF